MLNKHQLLHGQILLIICFVLYLIWWYRGFRPGSTVSRVKGTNGLLLALTAITGIAGIALSLLSISTATTFLISPAHILISGVIGYIVLLLITRFLFNRIVTSELLLIVVWTMLEVWVTGSGILPESHFWAMIAVIAVAFLISMICYVAYYKMEEMKAFYTAMVPLVLAIISMTVLVLMIR